MVSLDRGTVTILSSSGEQISAWRWNNKKAVAAGWSDKEEVLFVLEEGIVVIYSMFGILQSSFTMGQEAQDVKLLTGRVFPTHSGTGVAVLTSTHRYVQSLKNCSWINTSISNTTGSTSWPRQVSLECASCTIVVNCPAPPAGLLLYRIDSAGCWLAGVAISFYFLTMICLCWRCSLILNLEARQ